MVQHFCIPVTAFRHRLAVVAFIAWSLGLWGVLAEESSSSRHVIPEELCRPFGAYPNLLNITDAEIQSFHPVILFPKQSIKVNDKTNAQDLASPEELMRAKKRNTWWNILAKRAVHRLIAIVTLGKRSPGDNSNSPQWSIGKYDENRVGMYSSELFQDTSYTIDGYGGQRTVHLGIDLGAPVGTKVYAFWDGIVHSAGYNSEFGDYGYVVVIEHQLEGRNRSVWALYGHLNKGSVTRGGKRPGNVVKKGQVIGRVGDCHENGGWIEPHVHFQLSMNAPETHDMPGASSVEDRPSALVDYPDPRYVLGAVH
jgi:murein DD-endopeptidase MepM/ murein hydrolase activator NlpD